MEKVFDFTVREVLEDEKTISNIEEYCRSKMPLNEFDIELLLNHLCYSVRRKIADYAGEDFNDYSFPYKCDLAQSMICYYLEDLGISFVPVNTNEVISGVCGHSFVLATINDKEYLIDPTYIQFFTKEGCDSNKFVIINHMICISPDPGYYVDKDMEKVILPLLENGVIEFNEDVAKVFGDSFFKTKTGTSIEQVPYNTATGSMYQKWFHSSTAHLSKTREELNELNLLINPKNYSISITK